MRIRIGKPKLVIGRKKSALTSDFHALLREAIAVTEKLIPLATTAEAKLSGAAMLNEAIALGKTSREQVNKLRAALDDGTPGLDCSRSSVNRIMRELLLTRKFKVMPADASKLITRLRPYCDNDTAGELSRFNASLVTLFCCAIAEAAERHPHIFGSLDSSTDLVQDVSALQAKQKELFARLGTAYTAEDIDPGRYERGRTSPAVFKDTDVPLAPADSAGKRLVEFLMSQREKRP